METDSRNLQSTEPILEDTVTVREVAAEIEKPTAPRVPTRAEIGQWRRRNITVVHGTVKACGHKVKFSQTQQPHNNCIHCWAAYLMTSVDLDFIHAVLTQKGAKELVRLRGTKFTRMFHGWLATKMLPALTAEINK